MDNKDSPAMPLSLEMNEKLEEGYWYDGLGFTKREAMAMAAMNGIVTGLISNAVAATTLDLSSSNIGETAVSIADGLLAVLESTNE